MGSDDTHVRDLVPGAGAEKILRYKHKARIDNFVFSLHKYTAGILMVLSLLVSTGVYVKDPILCSGESTVSRVIDAYCWIHSTYTIPNKTNEALNDIMAAHPGVAQQAPDDESRVHKYYQWMCFVLFFQALAFYVPREIWKHLENGRILSLSTIVSNDVAKDEEDLQEKRKECVDYFQKSLGCNESWALYFVLCEVLNLVNILIQVDLTDRFVGRALSTYGLSIIQFTSHNPLLRTDAMARTFPTVTKCVFNMIGPTGNIIHFDNICVLPLNIYNEKFYPFMWIWFIILAALSALAIVYRVCLFLIPAWRHELLLWKFDLAQNEIRHLGKMNMKFDYGDWFLLYKVGTNMGPATFCDFLSDLVQRFANDTSIRAADKEKCL